MPRTIRRPKLRAHVRLLLAIGGAALIFPLALALSSPEVRSADGACVAAIASVPPPAPGQPQASFFCGDAILYHDTDADYAVAAAGVLIVVLAATARGVEPALG